MRRAILAVALLFLPLAMASVPEPSNPLINQDFELGLPNEVVVPGTPLEYPFEAMGSLLPRTMDPQGRIATPPWSATIYSGQTTPFSATAWGIDRGESGTGALVVQLDPRDRGVNTLTVAQSIAEDITGSVWAGAATVRLDASATAPVRLRVGIIDAQAPTVWHVSNEVVVTQPALHRIRVGFPSPPTGQLVTFAVFLQSSDPARGGEVVLDNIAIEGSRVLGLVQVPTESDAAVGRCASGDPLQGFSVQQSIPPNAIRLYADGFVCAAGLMPFARVCVFAPCDAIKPGILDTEISAEPAKLG